MTPDELDAMIARQQARLATRETPTTACQHDWGKWRSNGQRVCLACHMVEYDTLKDVLGVGDRGSR